ncbi:hypothetical protein C2869_05395 [Saccharobesus litoralis]|uniref:Sensory/regulatory protein RpfC n=1 Tax=Saccharobesus litoralis TaxID=2172099 RepID=A0A2S0VNW4_9ALTE|nr:response regulator [Saccharobesus litoralis]AWB65911.1 hypothetical protein C2869_05395 [Saccharobesus litoralis]
MYLLKRYWLEIISLLLFTLASTFAVHNYANLTLYQRNSNLLSQLEATLPKHTTEILNISFSGTHHYDMYAQLQLEIDNLRRQLSLRNGLLKALDQYDSTTQHYVQLVTMLKTSRRIVSTGVTTQDLNEQEHAQITQISLLLLQLLNEPNALRQQNLITQLQQLNGQLRQIAKSESAHVIISHLQFINDKIMRAQELKEQISGSQINKITSNSRTQANRLVQLAQKQQLSSYFLIGLSFIGLFIATLLNKQRLLNKKTQQYKQAALVKTQFLANMSHEIRTPMTGIIGLTELCAQTNLNPQQREYIDKLHFSATALLTIINDILDFSKIESGKLPIEQVNFYHHTLIDNIAAMLGKIADEKGIELIFDIAPDIPDNLIGDPVRVNQILLNLISNAVKFTEKGHVILKVRVQERLQYHTTLKYQVIDTGIGLSEAQQAKIFERFSQADESTTRKYGGTGLGLAISQLLAGLMQGNISVQSTLGKGSTFSLTLPFQFQQNAPEIGHEQAQPQSVLQGQSLLIVEDNSITQQVVKAMADSLGLQVVVCSDVKQALQACQQQVFNFALVDWSLPVHDGLYFIEQVKQRACPPQRIVICSAYGKTYIDQYSETTQAFQYLPKPITFQSLIKALTDNSPSEVIADGSQQNASLIAPSIAKGNNTATQAIVDQEDDCQITQHKVLLVEDNEINQTICLALLADLNIQADLAVNGQEAIEKFQSHVYPLVLMDIQMPIMDGREATKILRQTYSEQQVKIVALTANVTQEEIDHYHSIGMDHHLSKPYNKDQMKQIITTCLSAVG